MHQLMQPNRSRRTLIAMSGSIVAASLLAFAGIAVADPPRRGPPPEAFTACDGKASGDACSVDMHGTTIDGTCDTPPGQTALACRPNHPPPHKPSAEAFTACDGKASGAACTVSFGDHQVTGSCGTSPDDSRMVCIPKDMPPPPPGG